MKKFSAFAFVAAVAAAFFASAEEYVYYAPNTTDASCKNQYGYLVNKPNWTNELGEAKTPDANTVCVVRPYMSTGRMSLGGTINGFWYDGTIKPDASQGTQTFVCGGFGVKMDGGGSTGSVPWYGGLNLSGTGEVPFDIETGKTLSFQKELTGPTGTIVKKGGGTLNCITDSPLRNFTIGGIRHEAGGMTIGYAKPHDGTFTYTFAGNGVTLDFSKTNLVFKTLNIVETEAVTGHTHGFNATADRNLEINGIGSSPMNFSGLLKGKVNLVLNLPSSDQVFRMSGSTSTTSGRIVVRKGTLSLADGADFTATSGIEVDGADSVLAIENEWAFTHAVLKLSNGGKVSVPEGVTVSFQFVERNGERLPAATYTAANAEWVTGAGSLRVGHSYMNEIVLDISSGEVTLEDALAAYNAAHEGESVSVATLNGGADANRPLVKRGEGTLKMVSSLSNFNGAIHIETGKILSTVSGGMGKGGIDSPCWVYKGAVFHCQGTANNFNSSRTFRIAGAGPDNRGALFLENKQSNNWGMSGMVASPFYLEDDATVGGNAWVSYGSVTLNGHTLTVTGTSVDTSKMFSTFNDDGNVVVSNTALRSVSRFAGTTPGNRITVLSGAEFRFWDNETAFDNPAAWTIEFGNSTFRTDVGFGAREESKNTITPAAVLNGDLTLASQSDRRYGRCTFQNVVSGTGRFKLTSTKDTIWLLLKNAGNAFTGGVTIDRGVVWPYCNGAIPSAEGCGKVSIVGTTGRDPAYADYDGVAFVVPGDYDLPVLEVSGKLPRRIQCGDGRWKGVVKSGTGTLEYYSSIGAPFLDVQGGTVKLPVGAQPGLWEGSVQCADAAAATTAFNGSATPSNRVMRGVYTAIKRERYHYTPTAANKLITYSGYCWNRSSEPQTITLASSVTGPVDVKIDGTSVLSGTANTLVSASVTLTPGAHAFEYRAVNGAPYQATDWPMNFGFEMTAGSVGTSNTNIFVDVVDPGDGSLFTRTTNTVENLPAFDAIHVATGATLDLNGNTYVANDICGAGTVASSAADASANPKLVVKAMTIDAAKNEALTVTVPVEFDANFQVNVTNVANRIRVRRAILTANATLTMPAQIRVAAEDGSLWCVERSADGKSLELCKTGLTIFLR